VFHLSLGEVLHLPSARISAVARRDGEAPRFQLLEFLLRTPQGKLVLLDAQLHGTSDGITFPVRADYLAALRLSGALAIEVLEENLCASVIGTPGERLSDSRLKRGVDSYLDDPGCGGDGDRGALRT
ncbi:MAG TPA: hypothetical protein VNA24_02035, partial [Hyalangium sp.]|nr:hypothetical protein [Hyalangium sp.]